MSTGYTTRSGRQIKKPVRYEPVEICTDDYSDDDIEEEDDADISSESECVSDSEDIDENGNLTGFIASDDEA